MRFDEIRFLGLVSWLVVWAFTAPPAPGQPAEPEGGAAPDDPMAVLTPGKWEEVERSIDLALTWLASEQKTDGSFPTHLSAQPAVTSLCVMAFLARGHLPDQGPYGEALTRAIDYTVACQKPGGLIAWSGPVDDGTRWYSNPVHPTYTGIYNHAISSVMLCEVYGMTGKDRDRRIQSAIGKALDFTLAEQNRPKRHPEEKGGWRYLRPVPVDNTDSDLSVTSWQLMFLRAARNAGFDVPVEHIDQALEFVKFSWHPRERSFKYAPFHPTQGVTRAMAGAGILAFSLGGLHQSPQTRSAADWLLAHPFDQYNQGINGTDRFHYGAYYCSLGMFQMGGQYWKNFYPPLARTLVAHQAPEGHWQLEAAPREDRFYGNAYTTALAAMALAVPFQLVPIYQR